MKKIFILLFCFLLSCFAQANFFNAKSQFLKADDAFQLFSYSKPNELQLEWNIATDYYLYKKEIVIEQNNLPITDVTLPSGETYQDEFFGKTEIYREHLILNIPIIQADSPISFSITYQGCTKGFCYPPETRKVEWIPTKTSNTVNKEQENLSPKNTALSTSLNEQQSLAQRLFQSKYATFGFFLLGLGLAFTPCVLPMLPLLSAIVIGREQRPNTLKALGLSIMYVQGMALTYTLLGLLVALIGLPFQVALQSPYVLITLSIIFILLSLSMFGLFTLQLPTSLQTKLTLLSQRQESGAFKGVFIMGMIAGLVASPCTSAPLSGALLYVAQSGDLLIGGLSLYFLALGMGVPLILVTVFGNQILPKSGKWLEKVKIIFGFVMLALPIFLLSRLLPDIWESRLWAMLGISFCLWAARQCIGKGLKFVFCIFFVILAMSLTIPLKIWGEGQSHTPTKEMTNVNTFQRITNYAELQQALQHNPQSFAMLDLYADWCVACKEFEKYTFSDSQVKKAFSRILLLQVDMTKNSPENTELMTKLGILGLPTIVFFDKQGNEITTARITGFMPPKEFEQWLQQRLE